jgi:hypothetical protein
MFKKIVIDSLVLLILSGCCTAVHSNEYANEKTERQKKREEYVANRPDFTLEKRNMFLSGIIWVGMTKKEVFLCWGEPREKQNKDNIWIYGGGIAADNILYFENGILVKWEQGDVRPGGWREVVGQK